MLSKIRLRAVPHFSQGSSGLARTKRVEITSLVFLAASRRVFSQEVISTARALRALAHSIPEKKWGTACSLSKINNLALWLKWLNKIHVDRTDRNSSYHNKLVHLYSQSLPSNNHFRLEVFPGVFQRKTWIHSSKKKEILHRAIFV